MIGKIMHRSPKAVICFKKFSLVFALVSSLAWFTGCVHINDAKVQVQEPGQVEGYSRTVFEKCTPQVYPHRLIQGQIGISSPLVQGGPTMVNSQADFERIWNNFTVLDEGKGSTSTLAQIPVVDWDKQVAYFYVVQINNTCQKARPMADGMITDCYNITIPIYRYLEGTDCKAPNVIPALLYIYPKANIPVNVHWIDPTPIPTATLPPTATPTPHPPSPGKATPTPD